MGVKFLFLDEKYADTTAPRVDRVTSLTGVLVPANIHRVFRDRYYGLVAKAVDDPDRVISRWPNEVVHTSNLLPGSTNDTRFSFLEGVVELVNELDFKVFRVGYHTSRKNVELFHGESGLVNLCFTNILWILKDAFPATQVWPVMESDRSFRQDQDFAGSMQTNDYLCSMPWANSSSLWLKDSNLGEVFYVTKRSGYGSITDCIGYLLHAKWLNLEGHNLTDFKKQLAKIATGINTVEYDAVGGTLREAQK